VKRPTAKPGTGPATSPGSASVPGPLADLIGPLTFATRTGAPLDRIRGLADLVRARLGAWRETFPGGSAEHARAAAWLDALSTWDSQDAAARRTCLKAVLDGICAVAEASGAGTQIAAASAAASVPRSAPKSGPKSSPKVAAGSAVPSATVLSHPAPAADKAPEVLGTDSPVRYLPGVGERRALLLERLGIRSIEDLLLHLPSRYEDRSHIQNVSELSHGSAATVRGTVVDTELKTTPRRRMRIFEAAISDGSPLGGMVVARWFNQPFQARRIQTGNQYLFSGRVVFDRFTGGPVLENPECEPWESGEEKLHTGRVVAVYPVTEGLTSRQLRTWVAKALEAVRLEDPLPADLRATLGLPERSQAFRDVHRPARLADATLATRRFAFEEFFCLQVGLGLRRQTVRRRHTRVLLADRPGALETRLRETLPFALTAAQERVLAEIFRDLSRDTPMHRLVQGDVGCGKTVVALMALLRAVDNGFQGALMAPTEVLAEQHYRKLGALLAPLGVPIVLLTGGARAGRAATLAAVADGSVPMVVGTQALIQEKVAFHRLGVAVVDEQHRFGVRQRAQIGAKGLFPHTLTMTATPIPRSLAMTVYGDLDLSVIDQLPPGRSPVRTRLYSATHREQVYARLRRAVEKGRRAYVVHPLVEESEKSDLRAATGAIEELQHGALAGLSLTLLHGRMGSDDKSRIMADFAAGKIQVLVTTTVVEVGVDVAEATVMVVEHAERFGLSQLHQLRGRVGRGAWQGECLLVASHAVSRDGRARLKAVVESEDGFVIAERDLEIRGPGELFGRRQSGLPELKVANLIKDAPLLAEARQAAVTLLAADPDLSRPHHAPLRRTVAERWRDHLSWGAIG